MRKYRGIVIVPLALYLFVVCNANEEIDLFEKAIQSISNTMVKYESKFDKKVKFVELQQAIDAIDGAMHGYMGSAKGKLNQILNLNSAAHLKYEQCVKPMFEWCISSNHTFRIVIRSLTISTLSMHDKERLESMASNQIESGLKKVTESLELMNEVQNKTAELENLFKAISHEVHDDFGASGFYGKLAINLNVKEMDLEKNEKLKLIATIFGTIGVLIFSGIGVGLGLAWLIIDEYKISSEKMWKQKNDYKEQIELIDYTFKVLKDKIEDASKVIRDVNSALEEDRTLLHELSGKIDAADKTKYLILFETDALRVQFASVLKSLMDQCTKYNNWHGYDASFYQNKPFTQIDSLISHKDDSSQIVSVSEPIRHTSEGNTGFADQFYKEKEAIGLLASEHFLEFIQSH